MRKIIVHMQSTLNGCIANTQGTFWQPSAWGDPEQAHINDVFRAAGRGRLAAPGGAAVRMLLTSVGIAAASPACYRGCSRQRSTWRQRRPHRRPDRTPRRRRNRQCHL